MNNVGDVLSCQGKAREARWQFEKAVQINPDYEGARANLDVARAMMDSQ